MPSRSSRRFSWGNSTQQRRKPRRICQYTSARHQEVQNGTPKHNQVDLLALRGRAVLVKTRTQLVNAVRGMVKSFGYRLPSGSAERFGRLKEKIPAGLQQRLNPLMEALEQVQQQIDSYDQQIVKLATEKYPETLRQPWGVGTITSLGY